MPIYEYACDACGRSFEELIIRRSDEADVACPDCRGRKVSRLLSRTAATPSGGGGSGGGRSCGPIG
jgi:putative FmdB family regulatory protein